MSDEPSGGGGDSKPPRPPTLYEIPAGTAVEKCRAVECQKVIYWVTLPSGKKAPLDAAVEGGLAPTPTELGRGLIHFITCAKAARFHRPPARHPKRQRELNVDHKPSHCIFCGCSTDKPCQTPFTEFDESRQKHLRETYRLQGEDPPSVISCARFTVKPPICTAPSCQKRFDELPSHERMRAVRSSTPTPAKRAS